MHTVCENPNLRKVSCHPLSLSCLTTSNKQNSQLVLGMSFFDIIGALAWMFSTAPINSDFVYGAIGTEATCKIQGWAFQIGFTSIFYNVSLSTYYLLGMSQASVLLLIQYEEYILTLSSPLLSHCIWLARPTIKEESMVVARSSSSCGNRPSFWWPPFLSEYNIWMSHSESSGLRRDMVPSCFLRTRPCFWGYLPHHSHDDDSVLESQTAK